MARIPADRGGKLTLGAVLASAGVAVAASFGVDKGEADLFHVTRIRDAENIANYGLLRGSDPPAAKISDEMSEEVGADPMMVEESKSVRADRRFDEVVRDARYDRDDASQFPPHDHAVFFWGDRDRAIRGHDNTNWSGAVVGVDRSKLPAGCELATGPIDPLDGLWSDIWGALRNRGKYDEEDWYERAKDWWETVEPYTGQDVSGGEIWAGCDVPPEAIVFIEDPETGRVLHAPTEADQTALNDFF